MARKDKDLLNPQATLPNLEANGGPPNERGVWDQRFADTACIATGHTSHMELKMDTGTMLVLALWGLGYASSILVIARRREQVA